LANIAIQFVALFLSVWYSEHAAYPFWQQKGGG